MANYTELPRAQQPYPDWNNLPQSGHFLQTISPRQLFPNANKDISSLPHGSPQATLEFTFPGAFLPELPVDQQAVTYNSNLNNYFSTENSINKSSEETGTLHIKEDRVKSTNLSPDANYVPLDEAGLFSCLKDRQSFIIDPQLSFTPCNTFAMSAASSIPSAVTESSDQDSAETQVTQLRCTFPDCSQDCDFPTESALRKHQEKHSKPYICPVPNCKHPRFGDKGGLDRHKREVHGSKFYCCPNISCKRHTKGFPRKYNLFEHQKRCHPTASVSMQRSLNLTHFNGVLPEELGGGDEEPLSSEMTITGDVARFGSGKLQERLERLCALRAEFKNNIVELDDDIEALKRTLDIFRESSP
ncbi:hypothetical protein BGZ60DRAFT_435756 [Tricladium varicosporioides]|nr:hypothetical protein BGZ60DRAFT_435756 [Hymenoscyphus varicosporioides]